MATAPNTIDAHVQYSKWFFFWDDWKIRPGNASSAGYFEDGRIRLPKDSGPHDIVFHFDPDGHDLEWDQSDPIWVQRDSCPGSASSDAQIVTQGVDPSTATLTVQDLYTASCELHCSLNFVKPNGRSKRFDPIIINT